MREIIVELDKILPVVERVHGERHPELHKVAELYAAMKDNASAEKDNRSAEMYNASAGKDNRSAEMYNASAGKNNVAIEKCSSISGQENTMSEILAQLREITSDFTAPEDACPTYRKVYADLEILVGKLA